MQIQLIYAHDRNLGIGYQGNMPWKRSLSEDLAHFKAQTLNHPVIMGRKTWESLPTALRPLPNRDNLVLTRNAKWQATGARVFADLSTALAAYSQAPVVWVIGGASVYREALPLAQRIVTTEIDAVFPADTFIFSLPEPWSAQYGIWHVSASGLRYRFTTWERV